MTTDTQTENSIGEIKVHKLIAGPYHSKDDPDLEDEDFWWIECMVEYGDGYYEDMTLAHNDFSEIYKIVAHLKSPTVEPFVIGGSDD